MVGACKYQALKRTGKEYKQTKVNLAGWVTANSNSLKQFYKYSEYIYRMLLVLVVFLISIFSIILHIISDIFFQDLIELEKLETLTKLTEISIVRNAVSISA